MDERVEKTHPHNPEFALSPAEAAAKMIEEIGKDPGAWSKGVALCKKDIIALAASPEAEANFKAAMAIVLAQGLRALGLKEISTAELKRLVEAKSTNWQAGVSAKETKIKTKVGNAIAVTHDAAAEAHKLPKGLQGSAANKARMIAYFDARVKAKKERGT